MDTLRELLRRHGIGPLIYQMMIMNMLGFGVEVRHLKKLVLNICPTDLEIHKKRVKNFVKAASTAKINLDDVCLFDIIPEQALDSLVSS
jgi:hypothetical protein